MSPRNCLRQSHDSILNLLPNIQTMVTTHCSITQMIREVCRDQKIVLKYGKTIYMLVLIGGSLNKSFSTPVSRKSNKWMKIDFISNVEVWSGAIYRNHNLPPMYNLPCSSGCSSDITIFRGSRIRLSVLIVDILKKLSEMILQIVTERICSIAPKLVFCSHCHVMLKQDVIYIEAIECICGN